jgi:hypothetical protein
LTLPDWFDIIENMLMEFKPDENLTAYELWQVMKTYLQEPLLVNEITIPPELKHLFTEHNSLYKR